MIRKVWSVTTTILASFAALCCLLVLLLYLFGVRPYVVRSGSMEPFLQTGSLCFINSRSSFEKIQPGDLAAYRSSMGMPVLHRVITVTENGLETKGDANTQSDGIAVTKDNYLGKEVFSIPKIGYVLAALQKKKGRVLCLTGIVCLLSLSIFFRKEEMSLE